MLAKMVLFVDVDDTLELAGQEMNNSVEEEDDDNIFVEGAQREVASNF